MQGPMARFAAGILLLLVAQLPALAAEPEDVDIKITTHLGDRQEFVAGDRISFLLSLQRDAHVYLIYRDAAANLLQLLPNERMPDHFYGAGLFMPVPDRQQPFQFTVQPPYGEEFMYAFASDNGSLSFSGKPLANGLILLQGELDQIERRIRAESKRFFGRGELSLTTLPAKAAE